MDFRGFPTTLPDFQRVFPDDAACAAYLERLRWPDGFTCPKCKKLDEPYRFAKRTSVVLRCRACHVNTSLTATTVMQSIHMPLSVWFWGVYLVTTQTPGQSALQFQRQFSLKRYEMAFQMLTNYAPVLCVRSVIRLAISTQLRWINRSWAGVQKVKGVAFTIRQSSLVRLRYVPERLPLRGQDGTCYAGRITVTPRAKS